jgi:hypothetical protein
MSIFDLNSLHEHLNLYKSANPHNHLESHVIKLLALLLIVQ